METCRHTKKFTQSSKLVVSRRSLYASPELGMHNKSTIFSQQIGPNFNSLSEFVGVAGLSAVNFVLQLKMFKLCSLDIKN